MQNIENVLNERENTHGSFTRCAEISQKIKSLFGLYADDLNDQQRESLEMIAVKIARILNGGHNHADSWLDIAGYAQLGGGLFNPKEVKLPAINLPKT